MIYGRVVDREGFEAEIGIAVLGMDGSILAVPAVIDTGFTEYLTLPASIVRRLGLMWKSTERATVADEQLIETETFYGMVELDGDRFQVDVYQMEGQPLVGMRLLTGFRLTVEVTMGGAVTVKRLA